MVESAVINEMEADLTEMTGFYEKSTRVHVKALLEKEVNKIKDLILIERNKIIHKSEEIPIQKEPQYFENEVNYIAIKNYSWDQESKTVNVYISLDGIGEIEKNNITCEFEDQSFDLKIKGYKNQNLRFAVKKLHDGISKANCKLVIKKNSINLTLTKKDSKNWDNLYFKESLMKADKPEINNNNKEKEDPQESLMNMMKKLYQEGDDEMKKTIAQAWTKSQDEKDKKKI